MGMNTFEKPQCTRALGAVLLSRRKTLLQSTLRLKLFGAILIAIVYVPFKNEYLYV